MFTYNSRIYLVQLDLEAEASSTFSNQLSTTESLVSRFTVDKTMSKASKSKRTCTCKLLPWNLSTNTAAEYGDLGSITHRMGKDSSKTTASEPLHLAAQHGHISVTSFLLQKGFHADSGSMNYKTARPNTATPLHRACYSGAIGCIQLLLDHGSDLLARDTSFGDGMTPLHKAVKGGRFVAVAVIMKFCKANNDADLFKRVLDSKDASNRTSLELSKQLESLGEEEILSLRRWDNVAGGVASFSKCIDILENSAFGTKGIESNDKESLDSPSRDFIAPIAPLCDCEDGEDDNENCQTSVWEKAFTNAILKSTASLFATDANSLDTRIIDRKVSSFRPSRNGSGGESESIKTIDRIDTKASSMDPSKLNKPIGQPCDNCGTDSLTLFRAARGILVCRKCSRRSKSKR